MAGLTINALHNAGAIYTEVYLREGFYVLLASTSAKLHEILRKFELKCGNNSVGKKVNSPKGIYLCI